MSEPRSKADPDPHPDDLRIRELARGDPEALGALYDQHATALFGVALHILRNREDAEDLVHDVFVEAWSKAEDYDPSRGTVRRWLLIRTRSRAIDRLRSLVAGRRHGMAAARESESSREPAFPDWDGADRARARRAIEGLPEAQRIVLELGYFEGLTCAEIAQRCGIPLGTVKSRLFAAIGKLRTTLLENVDDPA